MLGLINQDDHELSLFHNTLNEDYPKYGKRKHLRSYQNERLTRTFNYKALDSGL